MDAVEYLKTKRRLCKEHTDEDGVLSICPDYIEGSCRKYEGVGCNGCRRKYWGQEAQDDDD